MGEAEAEALITVIKDNHSIITLILDDNAFADRGTKHIGTMLSRAKQLEQLRYVMRYYISYSDMKKAYVFILLLCASSDGGYGLKLAQ